MRVTLALYGGRGGEPTVVDAEVIRVCATESALVFGSLTDAQQDRLAALIAQPPVLEALTPCSAEGSRLIATQILERGE
jgi:hypothetical protein